MHSSCYWSFFDVLQLLFLTIFAHILHILHTKSSLYLIKTKKGRYMLKRIIVASIFFSSLISADDTLLNALLKSTNQQGIFFTSTKEHSLNNQKIKLSQNIESYKENISSINKWKLQTTITRHLNPMLNKIQNSACITCGMDKALGLIGQIQYHTSKDFAIGLKATILNPEYQEQLNKDSILENVKLNSLTIVCTLII